MAFRKQCDNEECGKLLGNDGVPFLQLHGSMSEQVEENGNVEYRYLTPHAKAKLAYCDTTCLEAWVKQEQARTPFVRRDFRDIHTGGVY